MQNLMAVDGKAMDAFNPLGLVPAAKKPVPQLLLPSVLMTVNGQHHVRQIDLLLAPYLENKTASFTALHWDLLAELANSKNPYDKEMGEALMEYALAKISTKMALAPQPKRSPVFNEQSFATWLHPSEPPRNDNKFGHHFN